MAVLGKITRKVLYQYFRCKNMVSVYRILGNHSQSSDVHSCSRHVQRNCPRSTACVGSAMIYVMDRRAARQLNFSFRELHHTLAAVRLAVEDREITVHQWQAQNH